jgi:2-polyprenyl-3-methyl-5-hydroxy-6-metoxy-1,4-benzoquinol methylase
MMARAVGPGGHVVGIDMDAVKVRLAQQEARNHGLGHVEFRTGDAATLDANSAYDVVYARLLLTHLKDPEATLRRMIAAVEPGGVVVIEDLEHSAVFAYPECPALDRYVGLYNDLASRRGVTLTSAPSCPACSAGVDSMTSTSA